jgi:hypothetical protein
MTHLFIIVMLLVPAYSTGADCKGKICRKPKSSHEAQRQRYQRGKRVRPTKNARSRTPTRTRNHTQTKRKDTQKVRTPKRTQKPMTTQAPKRPTQRQRDRFIRDKMLYRWTMHILLSDPEYGYIYRSALKKKKKGKK